MNKVKLVAGQLYQVKHWEKGWIIAEYVQEVAAHSYKYNNLSMSTLSIGPDKIRDVPLSHRWRKVGYTSTFSVEDKGMDVRPVTPETISTIASLRAEIKQLEKDQTTKRRELIELCN